MSYGTIKIPHHKLFFDEAAQKLIDLWAQNPEEWASLIIITPNIRASQSLHQSFVSLLPKPSFLPKIISIENMPAHFGFFSNPQNSNSADLIAKLFQLLEEKTQFIRLGMARSWFKQMEELARACPHVIDSSSFTRIFKPLWPGRWADTLYSAYMQTSTMNLRQHSEKIWRKWAESPPKQPIAIVGSTGSTWISQGWIQNVSSLPNNCILQRDMPDPKDINASNLHIIETENPYHTANWIASYVKKYAPKNNITIIAAQGADYINLKLRAEGIPTLKEGEYASFNETPEGQAFDLLLSIISHEHISYRLIWELLKKTANDHTHVIQAEKESRENGEKLSTQYLPITEALSRRPNFASLHTWWSYIKQIANIIHQCSESDVLKNITQYEPIAIQDVENLHYSLLKHIHNWYPLPKFRTVYEEKPSVNILGRWEGRGINTDHTIVCGLNDGSWPGKPDIEHWLTPHDREKLGLPDAAHFANLAYHDLICTIGSAPHVTWVLHSNDIACRWISSFHSEPIKRNSKPAQVNIQRPVGPKHNPIQNISVTEADRLMKDPYAYYTQAILKIKPLDRKVKQQNEERTALERGILFHAVLEQVANSPTKAWQGMLNTQNIEEFFWLQQLHTCLPNISMGANSLCEVSYIGKIGACKIKGRLDRIDIGETFHIIDYKTGTLPSLAAIKDGYAPQLALQTWLAAKQHQIVSGKSSLVSLKHKPDTRTWAWDEGALHTIEESFQKWLESLPNFPATGSVGFEHIERKSTWLI